MVGHVGLALIDKRLREIFSFRKRLLRWIKRSRGLRLVCFLADGFRPFFPPPRPPLDPSPRFRKPPLAM